MNAPLSEGEVDEILWAVELRVSQLRCALADLRKDPIRCHMDAADRALAELREELGQMAMRFLYPPAEKPARRPRTMIEVAVPAPSSVS